jgi:hypothetical protein
MRVTGRPLASSVRAGSRRNSGGEERYAPQLRGTEAFGFSGEGRALGMTAASKGEQCSTTGVD